MATSSLRILACLFLLVATGCGDTSSQRTNPATRAVQPVTPAVSDEQKAIEELKVFAADTHKKIKAKLDGTIIQNKSGDIKVTIDDRFTYDLKKSDSLLSKYDGEIYIGYRGDVVSGFAKGLGSSEAPKVIKCKYKDGSWKLDKPTLIYSDREFFMLPNKGD